jgi:hyperosmotically inducible periplasmic protein
MKLKLKNLFTTTLFGILVTAASAAMATDAKTTKPADLQGDWTTALHVKLALLEKLGTDSLHIEAVSTDGALTLTGIVDKRETMELASTVAKTVPGVGDVDNQVRLEASVANPSKPGAVVGEADSEVKDALLETRLRLVLIEKMGSDGFKIGTDAASGVVTLAFDHDLRSDRRHEAATVAGHVDGVLKVISIEKIEKVPVAKT